jgi:hypothetical protein
MVLPGGKLMWMARFGPVLVLTPCAEPVTAGRIGPNNN